jgi:TfoX/Sxy family transcriptional regulator of competence genes
MAYQVALAERIAELLKQRRRVEQKRMFGGVCFLVNGNMCCGVERNRLMVRVGPRAYEAALRQPHAKPMDLTGRPLRGFVFVLPEGLKTKPALKQWVDLGARYAASLPPKPQH